MGEEQRRFPRVPEFFETQCHRAGTLAEGWRRVRTIDMSAGGMSFLTDRPYDEGDVLEIQVNLSGRHAPLTLRGRVVRCEPSAGMLWCATEFVEPTPDQLAAIDDMVEFLRRQV